MGLNKAIIMGRLTADPELKRTQGGVSVTNFGVAVERNHKSGEQREVDYLNVVAWRGTAEFIARYFHKGSMIVVEGEIQTRKWVDKYEQKRVDTEILANSVFFGEGKKDSAPSAPPAYGGYNADGFRPVEYGDDDPF
jgi:single-strand DNA-binding protein